MSWTTAILHLFSQETDLTMKVIMKCVNIKLWDILGCFHYILNAPRSRHDLPISVDDKVVPPFREVFIFAKLRICEVSQI